MNIRPNLDSVTEHLFIETEKQRFHFVAFVLNIFRNIKKLSIVNVYVSDDEGI